MRAAALAQAVDRAAREGVPCYVYKREGYPQPGDVTWYVRTDAEGVPDCATLVVSDCADARVPA